MPLALADLASFSGGLSACATVVRGPGRDDPEGRARRRCERRRGAEAVVPPVIHGPSRPSGIRLRPRHRDTPRLEARDFAMRDGGVITVTFTP